MLWCPDALSAYLAVSGRDVALTRGILATGACIWLSFLAIQLDAALSPATEDSHRIRAELVVDWALTSPLAIPQLS